jgi:4-oxalocrotonate tautomerase
MPHIIVKLWPGKSGQQKQKLADEITRSVTSVLGYGDESVSVGFEEVGAGDWMRDVYQPDIVAKQDTLYKKPGYGPLGERA